MAETYVALLRGINVGKAGRLAMADLRAVLAGLGFGDVRTMLNSGNAVFTGDGGDVEVARRLESALRDEFAVSTRAIILTAAEVDRVVRGNPFTEVANPSRLVVAFLADPSGLRLLGPLLERDWRPEALAAGERTAYMWCPEGLTGSPLAQAVGKTLGEGATTRSWGTTLKLAALVKSI